MSLDPAALTEGLRTLPELHDDLKERINSLASEPTVDAMSAAAGNEVRAAVLGLRADIADGTVAETATVAAFFASITDMGKVSWAAVGEALLVEVVTGTKNGE